MSKCNQEKIGDLLTALEFKDAGVEIVDGVAKVKVSSHGLILGGEYAPKEEYKDLFPDLVKVRLANSEAILAILRQCIDTKDFQFGNQETYVDAMLEVKEDIRSLVKEKETFYKRVRDSREGKHKTQIWEVDKDGRVTKD